MRCSGPAGTTGRAFRCDDRSMDRTEPRLFRFGECSLNREARTLRRGERAVPLQPRQFDLLLYLLDHHERVVSQEELLQEVWRGIHVHPQSLRYALHAVRRAVGDRGDRQDVIRTYPKQGLRFVGKLELTTPTWLTLSSTRLLGREQAIEGLARGLDALALARAGSAFHFFGEAGIGKTTVLWAVHEMARDRGYQVVRVRCQGRDNEPAYWPWTRILRKLLDRPGTRSELNAVVCESPELAWALPELLDGENPHGAPDYDGRSARHRLFEGVVSLLTALSHTNQVVICVDDLHEADDDTLALTAHVAGELSCLPVLMAVASRYPNPASGSGIRSPIEVISGSGTQGFFLRGLTTNEVEKLVGERLGVAPSQTAVASLCERTSGNPLFLGLLLDLIEREERGAELATDCSPDVRVPREGRDAILRQVQGLPEATTRFLEVASVVGLVFSESVVRGSATFDCGSELEVLEPALLSGVIAEGDVPGRWRFSHPLVRECLYEGMAPRRRRAIHEGVGQQLELRRDLPDGPRALEIATHYARAAPLPEARRAIAFYLEAAELDIARAGFEAARASLDAASGLFARLGEADPDLLAQIWLRIGVVEGLLLRREKSRVALEHASHEAIKAGRHDVVCEAALCFSPHLLAMETGVYDRDLVRLLRQARELSEDQPGAVRARVAARLAVALHWSPRDEFDEAAMLIAEAARLSEGDLVASASAAVAGRVALYAPGSGRELMVGREDLAACDSASELMARLLRATGILESGDLVSLEAEMDLFSRATKASGVRSAQWYTGMFRATLALMRGAFGEAMTIGREFLEEGSRVGDRNAFHSFVLQRAMAALDMGSLEESLPAVAKMASEYPNVVGWEAGLCLVQAEIGRHDEASDRLDRLIAANVLGGVPRNTWLGTLGCLALAVRELDRRDLAVDLYEAWAPYSGNMVVLGFGSFCWGAADRFLGVLAGLSGWPDLARSHFESAIELNERCGALPALAHSHWELAVMGGSGRRDSGFSIEIARDIASQLGMDRLVQKIVGSGVGR